MVGEAQTANGERHAFAYRDGTIIDLGTLGGAESIAYDINDAGQLVGEAQTSGGAMHAFLYTEGGMSDLGMLPGGGSSSASAINNAGQIVGSSEASGQRTRAFLYANGQMSDLGTVGDEADTQSYAADINEAGQIVGVELSRSGRAYVAFWRDGGVEIFGLLGMCCRTGAAINDAGQMVGSSDIQGMATHAVLFTSEDDITDLGTLQGYSESTATGINSSGHVVGTSSNPENQGEVAFLYRDGQIIDLNTRLLPESGWQLTNATDINDAGQIVGWGVHERQQRAFLMTPFTPMAEEPPVSNDPVEVPEPIPEETLGLQDAVQETVRSTVERLEEIEADALKCFVDGEYFADAFPEHEADLVADFAFDALTMAPVGEAVGPLALRTARALALPGMPVGLREALNFHQLLEEYVHLARYFDAYHEAPVHLEAITKRSFLYASALYLEYDAATELATEPVVDEAKVSMSRRLQAGTAHDQAYASARSLINDFKQYLLETQQTVLADLTPDLTSQTEFTQHLALVRQANLVMQSHVHWYALPLYFAREARDEDEQRYVFQTAKRLSRILAIGGAYYLFPPAGALLTAGASAIQTTYNNTRKMSTDLEMSRYGYECIAGSVTAAARIHSNTFNAIQQITDQDYYPDRPQIAHAAVTILDNIQRGTGVDRFWIEKEAFTDLRITNLGDYPAIFEVSATYVNTYYGINFRTLVAPGEKIVTLNPGENQYVRVYYRRGERGEFPDEGTDVTISVLGTTATGTYQISTENFKWQPRTEEEVGNDSGTNNLLTSVRGTVEQNVKYSDTPFVFPPNDSAQQFDLIPIPLPIYSRILYASDSTMHTLEIVLENPFENTLQYSVHQVLPIETALIEATEAQIEPLESGQELTWTGELAPLEVKSFFASVVPESSPGTELQFAPAELVFSSEAGTVTTPIRGNAPALRVQVPLRSSVSFTKVMDPRGTYPLDLMLHNLEEETLEVTAAITAVDLDDNELFSWSRAFSLPESESTNVQVAFHAPPTPGEIIIRGVAGVQGVNIPLFEELITIVPSGGGTVGEVGDDSTTPEEDRRGEQMNDNIRWLPAGTYRRLGDLIEDRRLRLALAGLIALFTGWAIVRIWR